MNATTTIEKANDSLVGKKRLLEILFPNAADRPTVRWLELQCRRRAIPFIRLGRLIWFDVHEVRKALIARHTVNGGLR